MHSEVTNEILSTTPNEILVEKNICYETCRYKEGAIQMELNDCYGAMQLEDVPVS